MSRGSCIDSGGTSHSPISVLRLCFFLIQILSGPNILNDMLLLLNPTPWLWLLPAATQRVTPPLLTLAPAAMPCPVDNLPQSPTTLHNHHHSNFVMAQHSQQYDIFQPDTMDPAPETTQKNTNPPLTVAPAATPCPANNPNSVAAPPP